MGMGDCGRCSEWDGDGCRPREAYVTDPSKGGAGLAPAPTGPVLQGVDLEQMTGILIRLVTEGRWKSAIGLLQSKLQLPEPEAIPMPIHATTVEHRLRIHLSKGEWLLAISMLESERLQAIDDRINPCNGDYVRVHRVPSWNAGLKKRRS